MGYAILLLVTISVAVWPIPGPVMPGNSLVPEQSALPDCSHSVTNETIQAMVNQALSSPGPNNTAAVSTSTTITSNATRVESEIYLFVEAVCANPALEALPHHAGSVSPVLELQSSNQSVQNASVVFQWKSHDDTHAISYEDYWTEDLASGIASGPYSSASDDSATYGGFSESKSWSAWELWPNPTLTPLTQAGAWDQAVPYGVPPSGSQHGVPQGVLVDAVGGAWVGISPSNGGLGGGLLQTGYAYDASNPSGSFCVSGNSFVGDCNYGVWWEFWPYTAPSAFTVGSVVYVHDILAMNVYQSAPGSSYWVAYINDATRGTSWQAAVNVASYNPAWVPYYGQFVLETPSLRPTGSAEPSIMQVPVFNQQPVQWEYGFVNHARLGQAYQNNTFNIYQLTQCTNFWGSHDYNTNQNFVLDSTGYWGPTTSWPQESFNNGQYSWPWTNLGIQRLDALCSW